MKETMRPIGDLAEIFQGDLRHFADKLVLPGSSASGIPGQALTQDECLSALLAAHAELYPGADRRAVASLWATAHFEALLVPFLVLLLVLNRVVNPELSALGFTVSAHGAIEHIHVSDAGRDVTVADYPYVVHELIHGHLQPLVVALSRQAGTSKKVLFSNAGNLAEAVVERVGATIGDTSAVRALRQLLDQPRLPNGSPNPLARAVHHVEKGGMRIRRRRICCIRYLVPRLGYCHSCPCPGLTPKKPEARR